MSSNRRAMLNPICLPYSCFPPILLLATLLKAKYCVNADSCAMAPPQVLWMNGEVVTVALRQRFLDNFPESTRLLNTYSISETGE
eukprot:5526374-Pyramimonas_sp.AAC.1